MAGFDYAKMRATADRMLTRFNQGSIVLVRSVVQPGPNEWTPGGTVSVAHELKATVAAVTVDQANAKFIDGTVITAADLVVTCAPPPVVPEMTDTLTIDGRALSIKKIVQVPSAGVPVVFKLFVAG